MVGRFGPRSRIKSGDTVDVAVETGALHFFDLETRPRDLLEHGQRHSSTEPTSGKELKE